MKLELQQKVIKNKYIIVLVIDLKLMQLYLLL